MYDLVISNARLADADGLWNIGVKDGKIASVESGGSPASFRERIDAGGDLLLPGLIDAHVHTRDPGYPQKESLASACMAAAAGGVTTLMAMPNSNPPMTSASVVRAATHQNGRRLINVHQVGGACAAVPVWTTPLAQSGIIALDVYDDLFAFGTQAWIRLFTQAKASGLPLCFYLMDSALEALRKADAHAAGASEAAQILYATNTETEAISVARIFPMAAYFDLPVVLRMVSTAGALEMVRRMRQLYPQARVYVEVCVHYLFLTEDALLAQGGRALIHPPLRTQRDLEALWRGLEDHTVDYIASDHAPHAPYEKESDNLSACASGMVGLETMLALLLDAHTKGKLRLSDIQRLCCKNPAKIYGLSERLGSIQAGKDADLILVDTQKEWTVRSAECYTRGAPGPFEGWSLKGKPRLTVHAGKKVMENGNVIWKDGE
ncbi:dihydroorotase family protein [Anaerotruncus rubiinfantis]|uniref:dihydroorotase family protein n=1 Tax=Anaerotruncus rubiinfantis TaxID=1720200 RepID=UPI0034A1A517